MNTAQFTPAGTLTAEDLGTIHLIGVGGADAVIVFVRFRQIVLAQQ